MIIPKTVEQVLYEKADKEIKQLMGQIKDLKFQADYAEGLQKNLREENRRMREENEGLRAKNKILETNEKNLREALDNTARALSISSQAIGNLNGVDQKPESRYIPVFNPFSR